ncbi:MAG: NTP transferase domain-containing protein [Hyphomicrobiaceae bacterium]
MIFGKVNIGDAIGAVLAHSLQTRSGIVKKGRPLDEGDVEKLRAAGYGSVVAARLDADDVGEDDAAAAVAAALAGNGVRVAAPFTGRCNIYAESAGVTCLDVERLMALNLIDEAITVATVPQYERATEGQMLATVKIVPFAVSKNILDQAIEKARGGLVSLAPFRPVRAGLILTRLAGTKSSVLAKRERVMADRLAAMGAELAETVVVSHDVGAVQQAIEAQHQRGLDPILVFAASAIVDRNDVIPAALVNAGGEVVHLGMPVDPGNLLMAGRLRESDVIGVPSCAGSPKLNGFDWVLERRIAGLAVGGREISAMGVGGLLKEIVTRPQPREEDATDTSRREPRIACIVLAAGRSSRMGPRNKLLEPLRQDAVVKHVVAAATASRARPVVVVTGHQAEAVGEAVAGLGAVVVHNPDFAEGMSTSIRVGLDALPKTIDGAIIALGDMPEITAAELDRLIAAFAPKEGRSIVVPTHRGQRGNPVLWGAEFFEEMRALAGDVGARHILEANEDGVVELELQSSAVLVDVDTPEALAAVRNRSEGFSGRGGSE